MSTYSNRLQPVLQNLLQRVVWFFHPRSSCPTHISANVCGGQKSLIKPVTRHNISSCSVFHPRSSYMTTYISADVQRITLNASCMTISGERTEQLDIFCLVTGFTSDFLSFIDVELIRFFHGALQLLTIDEFKPFSIIRSNQHQRSMCIKVISDILPVPFSRRGVLAVMVKLAIWLL